MVKRYKVKRKPGPYIAALKIWNRGNSEWIVPKKGSRGHEEVLRIMNNHKEPWSMVPASDKKKSKPRSNESMLRRHRRNTKGIPNRSPYR